MDQQNTNPPIPEFVPREVLYALLRDTEHAIAAELARMNSDQVLHSLEVGYEVWNATINPDSGELAPADRLGSRWVPGELEINTNEQDCQDRQQSGDAVDGGNTNPQAVGQVLSQAFVNHLIKQIGEGLKPHIQPELLKRLIVYPLFYGFTVSFRAERSPFSLTDNREAAESTSVLNEVKVIVGFTGCQCSERGVTKFGYKSSNCSERCPSVS